jgi:ABC-2 type transport system permease protein
MYHFKHSLASVTDAFYWPAIDLFIWGLTSRFFDMQKGGAHGIMVIIISGLLFWIIVWRAQYEITVNLLLEFWDKNFINLFVTPLKFTEWIVSVLIIGIIKAAASFIFAVFLSYFLYQIKIFFYGWYFMPLILLLILTGWWVGFFVAGIILRYGSKMEILAWSAIAAISPFSAIYYPVSILPDWAQKVAWFIPTSYVFEGARQIIKKGSLDMRLVWISLFLNIVYLFLSFIFLKKSFNKVLEKGLAKIY